MMRPNGVEKQVRPTGWQPGANTIAYYKFDGNLNDSSGNNRNLSLAAGSVTYGTESGGAKYGYFNSSAYTNNYTSMPYYSTKYTINYWYKRVGSVSGNYGIIADFHTGNNYFPRLKVQNYYIGFIVSSSDVNVSGTDSWNNYCVSISNGIATCYRNGTQVASSSVYSFSGNLPYFRLNTVGYTTASYRDYTGDGRMSALIVENKARTAQEITDYYNSTKSKYGVSESQASSCFLAGTPVLIEGGSKPIDELNIGDAVLSYNKSTGEKEYNKVVDIIEHTETKDLLYTLDIEGQRIEATEFHKFYISDNKEDWRWEEIRNLKEGQWVFSIGGAKKINSVESKKFDGPCYNITVDNNHNYFVYDGILVHNSMSTN